MTLEEKLKAKSIPLMQKYMWIDQPTEIQKEQVILLKDALTICQQEIDEACKKAKIEELGKFLIIVSGATDILDRMQTIEVLHNRIMELDKPPSLEPKSPSPLDEVR